MANQLTINIIINTPPFSSINGKEGIDLALVCAAFEQTVNLIFVDEGVLHLIEKQNCNFYTDKLHDKQLKALSFYDIDNVYAEKQSVSQLGLNTEMLLNNTRLLDRTEINQLIKLADHTVKF